MSAVEEGSQGDAPENQNHGWHPADWVVVRTDIEPWPEPVDGQALLDELVRTVQRFVVLPQWAVEAYPAEVARLSILGAQTDKKWWCFAALFGQQYTCLSGKAEANFFPMNIPLTKTGGSSIQVSVTENNYVVLRQESPQRGKVGFRVEDAESIIKLIRDALARSRPPDLPTKPLYPQPPST